MQTVLSAPRIIFVLLATATPALAMAADGTADDGVPRLGLAPGEPQVRSATPAMPFGRQPGAPPPPRGAQGAQRNPRHAVRRAAGPVEGVRARLPRLPLAARPARD